MKKTDVIELKPQTGLGALKFGMKKEELIEILGEPDQVFRDPISDDDHTLMEWNALKLRLTIYEDEGGRFGYIRTKNPNITYNGHTIIGHPMSVLNQFAFTKISAEWSITGYGSWISYFYEDYWMSLNVEYDEVYEIEMGVSFKNDDEFDWPD
jgi:hypothetical protein